MRGGWQRGLGSFWLVRMIEAHRSEASSFLDTDELHTDELLGEGSIVGKTNGKAASKSPKKIIVIEY